MKLKKKIRNKTKLKQSKNRIKGRKIWLRKMAERKMAERKWRKENGGKGETDKRTKNRQENVKSTEKNYKIVKSSKIRSMKIQN